MSGPRTGVFGGTFNPIHLGHLRAAEETCELLGLERMLFVPAADPPLKRGGEMILAPAAQRLRWVELAIRDNPRFAADDLELRREGPSYAVDTMRVLAERLAPERPVFVVGRDAFAEIHIWREPKTLLTLCDFAVMSRPSAPGEDPDGSGETLRGETLRDWMPGELAPEFTFDPAGQEARHREADTWVRRVAIQALDISATDVRRRLREGRSVRYLLPEAVRDAVTSSKAYDTRSGT
jgi:nicotinate-nucleotide adenylyltransferase